MAPIRTHYDNLTVARNAPTEVIRAAYRALAQKHHPDVNRSPDSARVMRLLNEAWGVLGDPQRRIEHDRWIAKREREVSEEQILHRGSSTRYSEPQGQKNADRSSSVDWHRGKTSNSDSAFRPQAASPGRKKDNPFVQLNNWLGTRSGMNWRNASILAAVLCFLVWINFPKKSPGLSHYEPTTQTSRTPNEPQRVQGSRSEMVDRQTTDTLTGLASPNNREQRPSVTNASTTETRWSPNGKPWPKSASYLKGLRQGAIGGMSNLTIDNARGGSDVYVKLCTHTTGRCNGLRHVFIPQGSSFSMTNIASGTYDIRYRDLSSGAIAQSKSIELQETASDGGWKYSVVRLTLYRVQGGNTSFNSLPEDKF